MTDYVDAAGESYAVAFDDPRDGLRFTELTEAFPGLSAEELLICIAQREGESHLWKDFSAAFALYRESKGLPPTPTGPFPAVSGVQAAEFLQSFEWQRVRMIALEREGARCQCCGRTRADGIIINVDHIKPRKKHPELALDPTNLQVLCNECNLGKGNKFQTDWRRPTA